MSYKVEKAVIPVAGLGTRMLPATKAIPKEMMPIVDKPLIQYVVNEAIAAGISEIVLVTHSSKNAIENHFDSSFELEARLEIRLKRHLLEEIRTIVPADVTIISVRQAEAKGLGHAIACAYPVVGNSPFAVLLPDVLVDQYEADLTQDNLSSMVDNFSQTGNAQLLVEPVPWEDVSKYGLVDCLGKELLPGQKARVDKIVEKPAKEDAPSNMAAVGRYVLPPEIWKLLDQTQPGIGGEIQLTDAIDHLVAEQTVEAYHIVGRSHDCGDKLGYMKAQIAYGLKHREVAAGLREFIEMNRTE
ncbi:MAG: UTP--glucose-1-phosphate uridylyltransferase GalU [Immundisolibacteraceae bacterium]|nr:UTP--glucose-1-phosphate uridylyltransferase GalU [Immundisolibacteraceae bacterium]